MKQDNRDIATLLEIMATLRDPVRGCPWDLEQDFGSIAPYTIEEAYEVADAIDRDDLPDLCDELGDLLLQVVFHAQMASEIRAFDFGDVVAAISNKMLRRHPHVFGTESVSTADAQRDAWESLKAGERRERGGDDSAIAGVGQALPALTRAGKLGKRAARVGFDWPDASGAFAKVREELDELTAAIETDQADEVAEEVGDLLLACTSLARHCQVDPEQALRQACRKFEARFRRVEQLVQSENLEWQKLSAVELDQLWENAKRHK
ncbi:MAG: nucleoside triphosphate pyrophosphohydrolase [Gammaproteobacteria bacterium]|nr:nucleoside triphosphate pyrophosphohydrolase [Gammaproteobacteria bacterium]MDH5275256.1 nucleoside triphosphate pyrophosphohydrolase [Gammaproteobacteria bacterium]